MTIEATAITECRECGSKDLSWFSSNTIRNDIQQGRLNTNDVQCLFVLGCNACSETLLILGADAVAKLLNEQTRAGAAMPVDEVIDAHACPYCGCPVLAGQALELDEWGHFHCPEEECGARLELDESGRVIGDINRNPGAATQAPGAAGQGAQHVE